MSDKNYHPDGFVPMKLTVPATEGFGFMPVGDGVSLNNMAHPINPNSLETVEIEFPDSISDFKPKWEVREQTPLTNELIRDIQAMCHLKNVGYDTFIMRFARAIERAHGIGA